MARQRSYDDQQLMDAIAESRSWRGTLRKLGLRATSAGAMRSVRSCADSRGIDYSHFSGQRRWTEDGLRAALADGETWADVVASLGLEGVAALVAVKGHAARLDVDTSHLAAEVSCGGDARPTIDNLHRSGSLLAAAWFTMCGDAVSWPLEPSRYDLLVSRDNVVRRVQVKTTTVRVGESWKVYISTARRERRTYDPDEIDDFFVIDGSLSCFLIPVAVVGVLQAMHLSAYERYRVPQWPAAVA